MPIIPKLENNKNCTIFEASLVYTVKIHATKVYSFWDPISKTENKKQQKKKSLRLHYYFRKKTPSLDFRIIINKDEREARDGSFMYSSYLPI